MKKTLALFLCILMFAAVVGCTKTPPGSDDQTTRPHETNKTSETFIMDNLPDNLNFNGMTIRTAYRENQVDFFVGESGGDIVSDAVYTSNLAVEERLGIKREWAPLDDGVLTLEIVKSIMTGDDLYDIVPVDQYYGTEYCAQGLYMDLSDLPYVDYTMPWYYTEYMESLSLGEGTVFYIAGDIYPITSAWTTALFWNKTLYGDVIDNDMLSLYKIVDEGNWTYEKYNQMVQTAYADIDNDGTKSAGDRFGTIDSNHGCEHLSFSMGFKITEKNDQGYYDVVLISEKNDSITELIRDHYESQGFFLYDPSTHGSSYPLEKFAKDECLFAQQFFVHVMSEDIRDMKSEFGVVPLPKYDETQKDYISTIHNSAFFVAVPVNVSLDKIDAIGALIEAQGSENYRSVRPVFFEDALKLKYNRDEENAEYTKKMIDLICSSYRIDFSYVYSKAVFDLGRIIHSAIEQGVSLSQTYASYESQTNQALSDLFTAFEEYKAENMK